MLITFVIFYFQAQSDDEEGGADDVAVNMDGRQDGSGAAFMDKFFEEVNFLNLYYLLIAPLLQKS